METLELIKARERDKDNATERRLKVRDTLYYSRRYANGSYKARKAMIEPFLMTATRGLSALRLYDDGSHQATKVQEAAMRDKCSGWRAQERELKRGQQPLYRQWLKDNKLKGDHFSYWLINVAAGATQEAVPAKVGASRVPPTLPSAEG